MRVTRFDPFTELRVWWKDIVQNSEWQSDTKKCKSVTVKQLGHFIKNQKGDLILSSSLTEDKEYDTIAIPWGCVTKVEVICGR